MNISGPSTEVVCTIAVPPITGKFVDYSLCRGNWNEEVCLQNTTVAYNCGDEYYFVGPSVTTCVAQDTWFPIPGRCVLKSMLAAFCSVLFHCIA